MINLFHISLFHLNRIYQELKNHTEWRVRRPRAEGHHRPDEGRAHRAGRRGVDRLADGDDGGDGGGAAGGEEGGADLGDEPIDFEAGEEG